MTNPYKLPICWLGTQQSHDGKFHTITADEVNLECTCRTAMAPFMCMEGHMTECHKGMNCEDAECSHYKTEMAFEDGIDDQTFPEEDCS